MLSASVNIPLIGDRKRAASKVFPGAASLCFGAVNDGFPIDAKNDGRAVQVKTAQDLEKLLLQPPTDILTARSRGTSQATMTISCIKEGVNFQFTVDFDNSVNVEKFMRDMLGLLYNLSQEWEFGPYGGLEILGANRPEDLTTFPPFMGSEAVSDVIPRNAFPKGFFAQGKQATTPKGSAQSATGQFNFFINWIGDESVSNETVSACLRRRADWVRTALAPLVDVGRSSCDQPFAMIDAKPRADAALYDAPLKNAFLTIHDTEASTSKKTKLKKAQKWVERGSLVDGSAVSRAFVICDSFENAQALYSAVNDRRLSFLYVRGEVLFELVDNTHA